jgi:hypothetical protein
MTSVENFGPQFADHIQVYRGYSSTPTPDHIDFERLGHHWTTDRSVAERFAIQDEDHPEEGFPLEGTVLSGMVDKKHVMPKDEIHPSLGVLDNDAEKEHTLRQGAPVKVTGATAMSFGVNDSEIRKEDYPPTRNTGRA